MEQNVELRLKNTIYVQRLRLAGGISAELRFLTHLPIASERPFAIIRYRPLNRSVVFGHRGAGEILPAVDKVPYYTDQGEAVVYIG